VAVALVVAAGRGERLGSDGPKAFVVLAGRPLIEWSLDVLRAHPAVEEIVVALPAGVEAPGGTRGVTGGAQRSHSVRNALRACAGDPVLVHDAARPLLDADLVTATLAGLEGADAAIAAAPVTDTVKEGEGGVVRATLDRSRLWAVQTPQAFRRAALERALDQPDDVLAGATDDASLVEGQGGTVRLVPSSPRNLKVTTPLDLELARLLLAARAAGPDAHRLPRPPAP
jgi:2-C-methyl-D-erythritol 4-phosphate cytidylyltransferase